MVTPENLFFEPVRDGGVQFVKLTDEEVVHPLDDSQTILSGQRGYEGSDSFHRTVLVFTSMNKEFRLITMAQERKVRAIDRNAQSSQVRDSRILARNAQPYRCSKAEADEQERCLSELPSQKIKRSADVSLFAPSAVMFARAQACAAKIEAQNGKSESIERFRRLIDHFVVHGAAE